MPVVVATIVPRPEHRAAVRAALCRAVEQVHDEPGCVLYALHEAPDRLVMIEQWNRPEDLEAHRRAAALAELGPAMEGRLAAEPEVVVLDPVPSGDADKGRVRPADPEVGARG